MAAFLLYICDMKIVNLSKHGLTVAFIAAGIIGWIQVYNWDVTEENFGKTILSGIFFLSIAVLMAVYRIHWVGRNKVNWISLGLFVLTFIGLTLMLFYPKNVMAFWKPSVVVFVLLCGYTFFLKLNKKNWSASVAKSLLVLTAGMFLFSLIIETSSPDYYRFSLLLLVVTAFFSLLQLFLPENRG